MEQQIRLIPAILPNGTIIRVEARGPSEYDAAPLEALPLDALGDAINGVAELVDSAVSKIKPQKVSVEFGFEVAYEPGKLMALLVNGSAKGNVKLCIEWSPGGK